MHKGDDLSPSKRAESAAGGMLGLGPIVQGKKRKAADGYASEGRAEQLADLLVHLQGVCWRRPAALSCDGPLLLLVAVEWDICNA